MRLFGRRRGPAVVTDVVDDGTLVVVAANWDPAASDGHAAAAAGNTPVLVRHRFAGVGAQAWPGLAAAVAEDGWSAGPLAADGTVDVTSTRVLAPLAASQTRARMAGLGFRLGAEHLGWEALRPAAGP